MKISVKETDEVKYWLLLCKESDLLPTELKLIEMIEEIEKILSKIISTSKKKKQN